MSQPITANAVGALCQEAIRKIYCAGPKGFKEIWGADLGQHFWFKYNDSNGQHYRNPGSLICELDSGNMTALIEYTARQSFDKLSETALPSPLRDLCRVLMSALVVLMFFVNTACGKKSSEQTQSNAPRIAPQLNVQNLSGEWDAPNGVDQFCQKLNGSWVCAPGTMPSECSTGWPAVIGGYSVLGGTVCFAGNQIEFGGCGPGGTAETYELGDGDMTLRPSGKTWGADFISTTELVVTYAPGCSLKFVRGGQ